MVGDRDRLETALRMLTKARLMSMHVPGFAVGRWCDAWEAEAERRGPAQCRLVGGRDPLDRQQGGCGGAATRLTVSPPLPDVQDARIDIGDTAAVGARRSHQLPATVESGMLARPLARRETADPTGRCP